MKNHLSFHWNRVFRQARLMLCNMPFYLVAITIAFYAIMSITGSGYQLRSSTLMLQIILFFTAIQINNYYNNKRTQNLILPIKYSERVAAIILSFSVAVLAFIGLFYLQVFVLNIVYPVPESALPRGISDGSEMWGQKTFYAINIFRVYARMVQNPDTCFTLMWSAYVGLAILGVSFLPKKGLNRWLLVACIILPIVIRFNFLPVFTDQVIRVFTDYDFLIFPLSTAGLLVFFVLFLLVVLYWVFRGLRTIQDR